MNHVPTLALFLASSSTLVLAGQAELTPAAAAAVEQLFPTGSVLEVEQETEAGVAYFEVAVRDGDRRVEVEVTADGSVGEIESVVAVGELPHAVAEGISRLAGGAAVKHAERHEVRGVARNGTFVPVEPPRILYEVSYMAGGVRKEVAIGEDGQPVPQADDDFDGDDDLEEEEDSGADPDLG